MLPVEPALAEVVAEETPAVAEPVVAEAAVEATAEAGADGAAQV